MKVKGKFAINRFWRFVCVGGFGFIVDATVLHIMTTYLSTDRYLARIASFGIAVTATWMAQRMFVFPESSNCSNSTQYLRHLFVQIGGAVVNFSVYATMFLLHPFFINFPVAALACGSGVALVVNYFGARKFVFN